VTASTTHGPVFGAVDELGAMLPRVADAVAACTEPAADDGAPDLDAVELLAAYADGVREPVTVVEACLGRLAADTTGAIWAVDDARARAAAEVSAARWRAGRARALEGVPLVVKDLLDTAGLVTTGGSRWLADRVPERDAAVVAAARAAGAVVIAKTATYELGCGDEQIPFGPVSNPWDSSRITGGSSAGSAAALAARLAPLALGTDTGGSIRIPSAWCGTVGLKPTLGRLPCDGLVGLAPSLDTPGPMARTPADVALLFAALIGGPRPPQVARDLTGRRIGVLGGWFTAVLADDVAAAFEAAVADLAALGADLVPVDIAVAGHGGPLSWLITMYEAARTYATAPRDQLSPAFRARLEVGERIDTATYERALRARSALTAAVHDAIAGCDVVVAPACVQTAPPFDDVHRPVAGVPDSWPDVSARTMALWNLTGLPSVAVPIGVGADGLPVGMQVAGAPFADEACLAVAAIYRAAT
jgi:aspartyl-tRNA(Asn)/glutamyl-tRNA(Gln) amidotransferase subunit A